MIIGVSRERYGEALLWLHARGAFNPLEYHYYDAIVEEIHNDDRGVWLRMTEDIIHIPVSTISWLSDDNFLLFKLTYGGVT